MGIYIHARSNHIHWCHSVGPHSFKPRSLEPYPLSRIPLGSIPSGRIPISRCPLSHIPFSRTSLISPSTRLALRASLVVAVRCCRRVLFLNDVPRIHQTFRCVNYIYVYLLYRLGYSSNVRALSKRVRVRVRAASDLRSFELRAFRPMSCRYCRGI